MKISSDKFAKNMKNTYFPRAIGRVGIYYKCLMNALPRGEKSPRNLHNLLKIAVKISR